jgi:hypothetical protein
MNQARVIIEGLRSGIPYRETADTMTVGRQDNLRSLASLMETVAAGRRPKTFGQIVRAQYGEGKTHLLHAMASQAWDANWVVSLVSLSKESPLDRLDHLYPKIAQNLMRPGSRVAGLQPLVTEALQASLFLSESRTLSLSDRTRLVLDNLARQDAGFEDLVGDLEGNFLTAVELKRIHRENFSKSIQLPASRVKDEVPYYFLLADWLIQRAGYQGWLILFDEVELMGKFGRGGRARSYGNLGRFLAGMGERTVSVWAVAGNFQKDVLIDRGDVERAPEWLMRRPQDVNSVAWARLALDELSSARPLEPPSAVAVKELIGQVFRLHQEAYGWTAEMDESAFWERVRSQLPSTDAKLRTWVRLSLALLDNALLYGADGGAVRAGALDEVDLSEDDADATGSVSRRRIFD